MADPGHAHNLKEQVKEMRKEAEHEKNVKEKHHVSVLWPAVPAAGCHTWKDTSAVQLRRRSRLHANAHALQLCSQAVCMPSHYHHHHHQT